MLSRFLILLSLWSFQLFAQNSGSKNISVNFSLSFNHLSPTINDSIYYPHHDRDSILFSECKFYLSRVELMHKNRVVWKEENSFHLINFRQPELTSFQLSVPDSLAYDALHFLLGTDSITNVSGAMGGVLDPVQGMYWTWHSGYINFKIEGKHSALSSPKKEFIFHLGGYQHPHATAQWLTFESKDASNIRLAFDLLQWIDLSGLTEKPNLMSPGARAKTLSQQAASCFHLLP